MHGPLNVKEAARLLLCQKSYERRKSNLWGKCGYLEC